MKKAIILLTGIFLLIAAYPNPVSAETLENGKNDRKGFLIGLSLGGGMTNISGGGVSRTRAALISDFKIGGGITENILIMYDGFLGYTKIHYNHIRSSLSNGHAHTIGAAASCVWFF